MSRVRQKRKRMRVQFDVAFLSFYKLAKKPRASQLWCSFSEPIKIYLLHLKARNAAISKG